MEGNNVWMWGLALLMVLGDAGCVRSEGRAFDVATQYAAPAPVGVNRWPEPIEQRAARVVLRALESDPGDVLVFLPCCRRCPVCRSCSAGW